MIVVRGAILHKYLEEKSSKLMIKDDYIPSMMMLFTISAAIIGVSAAVAMQDANAASNDDSSCRRNHHPSDTAKKCSKNDTSLILPFLKAL